MRYYFHADTEKYGERLRHIMIVVIVPIFAICTFCTVNIVFNSRSSIVRLLAVVIGGCVLFGMLFAFAAVYITERLKRRHARYTFFDFVPDGMVFSEYAGEFTRYGERNILRRLYYIPFAKLESVSRNPKEAPHNIVLKGGIRKYFLESDRLGYHIGGEGELIFDTAVLNIGYYESVSEVVVKDRFGNTKKLEKAVLYHWEQFKSVPEKKPFDIAQYVAVRKKIRPTTSNPALEAPSYKRNWK